MVLIYRKIIAASLAATLHSIVLGFLFPNLFGDVPESGLLWSFVTSTPVYMSYVFPAMFTYGILTSLLSDKAGSWVAQKSGDPKMELMISGSMHLVFGLILLWYSLPGAVLYFLIDRQMRLKSRSKISGSAAALSLLFPLLTFVIFIVITSIGTN
ncbi:hypothetical protein ACX93W_24650 [Paenibacillus sp. CAU 1782]